MSVIQERPAIIESGSADTEALIEEARRRQRRRRAGIFGVVAALVVGAIVYGTASGVTGPRLSVHHG
jgi:hypothetical protein